jgi:hypothetical protein
MKPLQSQASLHAQIQECIVQSQRTTEWSQKMIALSKEKMAQSEKMRRQTRIRIGRRTGYNKRFKLRLEAHAPAGLRFFQLSYS